MKIIVNNEDNIEEVVDSNIVRLEENDIIIIKTNIPTKDFNSFIEKLREAFPKNKVVLLPKDSEIEILRQPIEISVNNIIDNRKVLMEDAN